MSSAVARLAFRTAAVVLCAAALHRFAYLPWEANHVLYEVNARSERAVEIGGSSAVILARENIDRLREIAATTRGDATFYMLYAANARIVGNAPLAIQQYSLALATADHRPEIYYERGLTYLALGNIGAASADLTHAARFNPTIVESLSGELRESVARGAGIR